ncbi:hypothetical protein OAV88_02270 [bacterium]|nr:hypothetical protein [bacterium]
MSSDQLFPRGGGGNVSASSNEASATSESLFGTSDKKRRRETSKIAKKSIKQQRLKKKKSSSSKPQREMYDRELELSFDDLTIGSAILGTSLSLSLLARPHRPPNKRQVVFVRFRRMDRCW